MGNRNSLIKICFFAFAVVFTLFVVVCISTLVCKYNAESDRSKVYIGNACKYMPDGEFVDRQSCVRAFILDGYIDDNMVGDLEDIIKGNPDINNICFSSQGGYLHSTLTISKIIRAEPFNTCLSEYIEPAVVGMKSEGKANKIGCQSSCPFVLVSGKQRLALGENLNIGLHHPGKVNLYCFFCYKYKSQVGEKIGDDENQWLMIVENSADHEKTAHKELFDKAMTHPFEAASLYKLSPNEYRDLMVFTEYL